MARVRGTGVKMVLFFTSCFSLTAKERVGLFSDKLDIIPDVEKQREKADYLNSLPSDEKNLPNILIITADDLGRNDISCYGGKPEITTPNLDKLAKNGVMFTNGYSTAPISAPSRAGLLTGRDQNCFGFCTQPMGRYAQSNFEYQIYSSIVKKDNMRPAYNRFIPNKKQIYDQGLPHSEITMAEMLRARGYATALIGKWHLGYEKHNNPIQFGFDTHYGFLEAFSLFAQKNDSSIVYAGVDLFSERHIWRQGRKGTSAILRDGTVIKENRYLTDAFAEETINFIKQTKKNSDKPFFVLNTFNAPHTPFQAQKSYYDKFEHIKEHKKRVYLAMILNLDDALGKIFTFLEDAGLSENTLIIFSSDNGGAEYTGAVDNDPLKGGKFSLWEGGIQVPYIIYWKGKFDGGKIIDEPVIHTDIFATVASASKTELPKDRIYDGKNLTPLATEKVKTLNRDALFWQMVYITAVRSDNWKLIYNRRDSTIRLYDLKNDPMEKVDLHQKYPQKSGDLLKKIERWREGTIEPLWPHVMEYNYIDEDATTNKNNWYPL